MRLRIHETIRLENHEELILPDACSIIFNPEGTLDKTRNNANNHQNLVKRILEREMTFMTEQVSREILTINHRRDTYDQPSMDIADQTKELIDYMQKQGRIVNGNLGTILGFKDPKHTFRELGDLINWLNSNKLRDYWGEGDKSILQTAIYLKVFTNYPVMIATRDRHIVKGLLDTYRNIGKLWHNTKKYRYELGRSEIGIYLKKFHEKID